MEQTAPKIDFTALDYDAAKQAHADITQRLREVERAAIATLEVNALKFGYKLIKIGLGLNAKVNSKPKSVYINPDNPEESYGGRGRKPAWLEAKLAEGATLEQFRA